MSQEVIRGIALPPPAQPGDPLASVDTPSLVLDLAPFEANLRAMQAWADRHDVALRPHAKAHKCPQIALRQLELGARGIRSNIIAPGAIETDFGGGRVRDNAELNAFVASETALGRVGLPDDIGSVVAFLCSDAAKWVNAQRIEASGGMFL